MEKEQEYYVMMDCGCYEGWKVQGITKDWNEAVEIWKSAHGNRVEIFRRINLEIMEKD